MNTKTTPKDFFLHLGATIALYVSAVAFINLSFEIINRSFPDALQYFYGVGSIVWPISILVVLIPILYVLEWMTDRDTSTMPEKLDLWIRRWRIYLTLFITGAVIAGDLITLISTYLNGEITSRFIFKVLVVLIVSAVIFSYYILKRVSDSATSKKWKKALVWIGSVLVIAGIVGGFIIVGSPAKQRSLRFDSQRVSDLSNIQYQILYYWQRNQKLPVSLQALNDPISSYSIPTDPKTKQPYEYSVNMLSSKSPFVFELCATFDLPSSAGSAEASYPVKDTNNTWTHDAGKKCFERTIDQNLYQPIQKSPLSQ